MKFQIDMGWLYRVTGQRGIATLLTLVILSYLFFGICFGAIGVSIAEAGEVVDGTPRPNIIVIVTDDQGTDASSIPYFENELGCFTPNLANFASQGRVFTNCRVNPKCSPTRAGLMTGRSAWNTGVVAVLTQSDDLVEQDVMLRDRASLQTDEVTIAERLKSLNYNTILVGKWHNGRSEVAVPAGAQDYHTGQVPLDQGFDVNIDYRLFYCNDDRSLCGNDPPLCDCPEDIHDDHITWEVDQAVDAVVNLHQPKQPYALFFCTNDPHVRDNPRTWWETSPELLSDPSIYNIDDETDRYRAVIEGMDHEIGRLLSELGVINPDTKRYRSSSNTVVFFVSDNGTPQAVSFFGPNRSKASLFEGGIRVPMFVFGENVPTDGVEVTDLVSHQDFFSTLAQIAGDPNPNGDGVFRGSLSFADLIGWSESSLPRRRYSVSNRADFNDVQQTVSITDGVYKLIVPAGGTELSKLGSTASGGDDILYKISDGETENIAMVGNADYERLRNALVDYWPSAVSGPFPNQLDIPAEVAMSINSENSRFFEFGPHPVGYEFGGALSQPRETRLLLRFDISDVKNILAQQGRTLNDITNAQVIFRFSHDSVLTQNKDNFDYIYDRFDADTAALQIFPMLSNWDTDSTWAQIKSGFDEQVNLGTIDPAPHILQDDPNNNLETIPLENGTPVSFGRRVVWRDVLTAWSDTPFMNRGIVVKPTFNDIEVPGDQRISFRYDEASDVILRISVR